MGIGLDGIKVTLDGSLWVITDSEGNYSLLTSAGQS